MSDSPPMTCASTCAGVRLRIRVLAVRTILSTVTPIAPAPVGLLDTCKAEASVLRR